MRCVRGSNHYQKFIKMFVCFCTIHFRYGLICFSQYEVLAHSFYDPLLFPIFSSLFFIWMLFFFLEKYSFQFSFYILFAEAVIPTTVKLFNWSRVLYISIGAAFNQGHSIYKYSIIIYFVNISPFFLIYTHLTG